MLNRIKKLLGSKKNYGRISYALDGEDLVLNNIVGNKEKGVYIDVGAYHPQQFSNTYFFYKKGWEGINIDAMPKSMISFKKERPRDINLEYAISDKEESLTYYIFNVPALNTFSEEEAKRKDGLNSYYQIIDRVSITTKTLSEILHKHISDDVEIDFLNIDVEGLDYQVLVSNDWNCFKPKVILIEELWSDLEFVVKNSKIKIFLETKGYKLIGKNR